MIYQVENRNQPIRFRTIDGYAVNNKFLRGRYFKDSPTQKAYAFEVFYTGPYGSVRHQCELHWCDYDFKEINLIA